MVPLTREPRNTSAEDANRNESTVESGRRGILSNTPIWILLALSGLCDSWGNLLGFIAQPWVPGTVFSLMTQAIIPFTVLTSAVLFKRTYTAVQMTAVTLVITGGIISLVPELKRNVAAPVTAFFALFGQAYASPSELQNESREILGPLNGQASSPVVFSVLAAVSTLPTAISFALKEKVFRSFRPHLFGQSSGSKLDVFIVNAHTSAFQLLWTPFAIPINCLLGETHGQPLLGYVRNGFRCFSGSTPPIDQGGPCQAWGCCRWALASYAAYICINVAFNIILLTLLRTASALWGFMCMKAVLPVSIALFFLPWPLLNRGDTGISRWTFVSLAFIIVGIGIFKAATLKKERIRTEQYGGEETPCCFPLIR